MERAEVSVAFAPNSRLTLPSRRRACTVARDRATADAAREAGTAVQRFGEISLATSIN